MFSNVSPTREYCILFTVYVYDRLAGPLVHQLMSRFPLIFTLSLFATCILLDQYMYARIQYCLHKTDVRLRQCSLPDRKVPEIFFDPRSPYVMIHTASYVAHLSEDSLMLEVTNADVIHLYLAFSRL